MANINILPSDLVSKIAAGEVVERPASVVKELVENALDAGAEHIDIKLRKAGTEKIVVQDDGCGMDPDDLKKCFLPHATSKVTCLEDLGCIASFGFRGEALSSIASVSTLKVRSRQMKDEHGYEIEVQNGQLIYEAPVGKPIGTEVEVLNLFASTPVRKKFLKDVKAELRRVVDIVSHIALAYPHVGFSLTHDGNTLFSLPHGQDQKERMLEILAEVPDVFIEITRESEYGKVKGYASLPSYTLKSPSKQFLFVNNRPVNSSFISRTLIDAYGTLLEPRTYPLVVLFLEVPYESVDVNIHPRKEEVSFMYPGHIFSLIRSAIEKSLSSHNLTYRSQTYDSYVRDRGMDEYMADSLKTTFDTWNVKNLEYGEILQIHNLYLLAQTPRGLLLVDQHAAHERIHYEQFKEAFEQKKYERHDLEESFLITLSPADAITLEVHLETFSSLGFDIERFGENSFKVSAVPKLLHKRDYKELIQGVLADLEETKTPTLDRKTHMTLAYLACRSAIKAGDALTYDERKRLIEKLLESETPYTCPHGRPTHIEVSLNEIDRLFRRK